MKRITFRIVIVGLLISWGVELIIPLIHTTLDFIGRTHLRFPLTHYLLWGYLPVVLSGIYVGLSKTNNKIVNGIIVGTIYYITSSLFVQIITNRFVWIGFLPFVFAFLKRGVICAVGAWSSYQIKAWLKNRIVTFPPAEPGA